MIQDGHSNQSIWQDRIRVVDILELLSSGAEPAEILIDYPDLEREDILACLSFALEAIKSKE